MLKTRVIPCLLLSGPGRGLVKTVKFKDPTYVGDPINAVKIFNDKEVDELVLLDIGATREARGPAFDAVREIASECFMPLAYGGGVRSIEDMRQIFTTGIEKCVLNTAALAAPKLVETAAREFGSQSVVVSIDVKKGFFGKYEVYGGCGTRATGLDPVAYAKEVEGLGAGEIFVNAIDRDGTMQGYDLGLVKRIADAVSIPLIACGGAGSLDHLRQAVTEGGASAVAAGSMFVFHGRHRAVLITYPTRDELERAFA